MNALTNTNTELQSIEFNGDQIVTAMVNGQPHVAMRPIVENLELAWQAQSKKINAQRGKFNCNHMVTVGADGKMRQMLAIPTNRLTLWLASINPNKIKNKLKRQKIELYQAECAEALYNYWNKGISIRGDTDGVVTDLDPKVMQAIGGMMKGIVHKELCSVIPAMVQQELGDNEYGIVRGVTAYQATVMAGVGTRPEDRKGLRGLGGFTSKKLGIFHEERGIPVKRRDLYGKVSVRVFDKCATMDWLAQGGKRLIHNYVQEKQGQNRLQLVGSA